ncbi:MAG: MFS transporter, partial [Solirubrobacteraceae bacterium]
MSRNREFALLWSGQAISQLGSQISLVAFPLLVLAITGSPAQAGLVAFVRNVPIAALALPAGLLADRVNRRHVMVVTDGVRALTMASIPIAAAAGRVPYALILV